MTDNDQRLDILCFGEPLYEFNEREPGVYQAGYGGDVSNCAIAAARCGARTGMLAWLGADQFGDAFMQLWADNGINTDFVTRNPARDTGVYFVSHDADGHHFSYLRRNSASAAVTTADLSAEPFKQTRILHVSGISQGISHSATEAVQDAIGLANTHGVTVAYDTNLRLKLWELSRAKSVIHETIAQCDIALVGQEDAEHLTGLDDADKIADYYLQKGPSVVALTLGSEGVLVADSHKRERIACHAVNAIDCNGAGDTFDGAFLSAWVSGEDAFAAARYANFAAALSTTRPGAVNSIPWQSEIMEFRDQVSLT